MHEGCNRDEIRTGIERVTHCRFFTGIGKLFPGLWRLLERHHFGVHRNDHIDQPPRSEKPFRILEISGDRLGLGRHVREQLAALSEIVIDRGVGEPEQVGANAANLALGGDFGSDLSASGAVYLHSNVRALFHESIGKLSCELLRHGSVKQNSSGRFALRKSNRRAEHDQPDHGSHHEAESLSQSSSHMDLVVDVSLLVILPIEHLETSSISAPFPVRPCGPIPR